MVHYKITPKLFNIAKSGNIFIKDQPLSYPVFLSNNSEKTLHNLVETVNRDNKTLTRLAVDGNFYMHIENLCQPIFSPYVSSAYGMDITDLGKFLCDKGSDGILSRCDYLSLHLKLSGKDNRQICAIDRNELCFGH
jgi:hypothetical protein